MIKNLIYWKLDQERVAVKVRKVGPKRYEVVPDSLCVIQASSKMFHVPEEWEIVTADGDRISPTGRFLMSVETIDPYHLITDFF